MARGAEFLCGVIEGFYGKPWSAQERSQLIEQLGEFGLNTYLYAPKDDLKHRALWRIPYSETEAAGLRSLIEACRTKGVHFFYAIAPGLDMAYASESPALVGKLRQLAELGCENFAVLFDDIPDAMTEADRARFGSFAAAQAFAANEAARAVGGKFLFCPTPYCGRMARRKLGGADYLRILGRELDAEIEILWTGPEIISAEISVGDVEEVTAQIGRKPMIWDNLHANDYDGRRFFCGPYSGRAAGIREKVSGILSNPNCEFPLNYVALRTLGMFAQADPSWNARKAYKQALEEWRPRFERVNGELPSMEDLTLFSDCFYLPHEDGLEAEGLFESAKRHVRGGDRAFKTSAARLKQFCAELTELKDRELFYALWRRAWELREELDLLEKFPAASDFHLPGTYRGGFVPRLQRLLKQNSDGSFSARS